MRTTEALLAAIIAKADDPETAAKAIVAAGLCATHDLEDEFRLLWETVGPRSWGANVDRCSVHVRWRPDRTYLRAGRWSGTARYLPDAISTIIADAKADQTARGASDGNLD